MLEKTRVRELAASFSLPVAQKHESQEICFIPDNDYVGFLERNGIAQASGDIIMSDGTVIGQHSGIHRYTVGQRKGMGLAWKYPLHVLAIQHEQNRIIVGAFDQLEAAELSACNATWAEQPAGTEFRAACKIRYRHTPAPCTVMLLSDCRFTIRFDTPQKSITPGQAAVLYDGDRVLGGGWIDE
jgi:tRNA-specific 2-thiouridylase